MWNLKAFLDETGHADDPGIKFMGMAGLIATSDAWDAFEPEWWAVLGKYGIPSGEFFHMKDYAHSRGVFAEWKGDEGRRKSFLKELMETVRRAHAIPFGTAIPLETFRAYPKEVREIVGNHPYHLCFLTCAVILADLMGPARAYGEKISPIFAEISDFKHFARPIYDSLVKNHPAGDLVRSPVFRPMRTSAPLQAADLVAYETHKEAHRRYYGEKKQPRWGWSELIQISKLSVTGFEPFIFQNDRLVDIHMRNAVLALRDAEIQVKAEMERERRGRETRNREFENG